MSSIIDLPTVWSVSWFANCIGRLLHLLYFYLICCRVFCDSENFLLLQPTLHFFQNGKKASEVIGADVQRLKDTMEKLYKWCSICRPVLIYVLVNREHSWRMVVCSQTKVMDPICTTSSSSFPVHFKLKSTVRVKTNNSYNILIYTCKRISIVLYLCANELVSVWNYINKNDFVPSSLFFVLDSYELCLSPQVIYLYVCYSILWNWLLCFWLHRLQRLMRFLFSLYLSIIKFCHK